MKTKEELKNEKIFADFIELYIEFGNYENDDYWYYKSELSRNGWREFNPKEDWNLLMKAIIIARKIIFNSIKYDDLCIYVGKVNDLLITNSTEFETNELIYEYLIMFIKKYNEVK